ncbi:PH domain-containing protein [Caldivirga sp.]|uniref:PH domain-containing protein n=1 Tax=Caldivirga sp. TaxID=2080243 RepID=UPI0025C4B9DE|nr:PH domain-containing protein [Caldivirga sp.]
MILRPVVTKTLIKALIPLLIILPLLNLSRLTSLLIFTSIYWMMIVVYVLFKRAHSYEITSDYIEFKGLMNRGMRVKYWDIEDVFVSQGPLARLFNCGSVIIVTSSRNWQVVVIGSGYGVRLWDVREPWSVQRLIISRLREMGYHQ